MLVQGVEKQGGGMARTHDRFTRSMFATYWGFNCRHKVCGMDKQYKNEAFQGCGISVSPDPITCLLIAAASVML